MKKSFMTEAEIEKSLEKKQVKLIDMKGKSHVVEATRLTWYWFLIITTKHPYNPHKVLSDALEFQADEHPNARLGDLFESYIASILKESGNELRDFMVEEFRETRMTDHLLYKQNKAFHQILHYSDI